MGVLLPLVACVGSIPTGNIAFDFGKERILFFVIALERERFLCYFEGAQVPETK